jgi:hypothetical protein
MKIKKIVLITCLILIASCNSDDDNSEPQNCTEVFIYGLKVTVKDITNNNIITEGVTVTATDESYMEELMRIENSDYFIGAGEREGTYVIEITSSDYVTFVSDPIEVEKTEDNCHVITKEVEFFLESN